MDYKYENHHELEEARIIKILHDARWDNGRIGKLENWRAYITGGLIVLNVLLVPLAFWAFTNLFETRDIDKKVESAITEAFNKAEFEIIMD